MANHDHALTTDGRTVKGLKFRRHEVDGCEYCDKQTDEHHPSHDASARCESGSRNHCTCDTCW